MRAKKREVGGRGSNCAYRFLTLVIPLKAFLGTAWIWFSLTSLEREGGGTEKTLAEVFRALKDIWSQMINNTTNIWSTVCHTCTHIYTPTHTHTHSQLQYKGIEGEQDGERKGMAAGGGGGGAWYDIYDQWNNLVQRASKTKGTIWNSAGTGPSTFLKFACVYVIDREAVAGKEKAKWKTESE